MHPAGKELLLGQGPNPYGGGYAVVFLLLMSLTLAAVVLIIFIMRRRSPKMPIQKTPRQLLSRFAGFLLGCLIVAITAFLVDLLTDVLEFSTRFEVSDDGTVTSGGIERSESGYRFGRLVHYFSMLGYLASGVAIGVRMQKPFYRNGLSSSFALSGGHPARVARYVSRLQSISRCVVSGDTADNLSSRLFRRSVVNMSAKLGSVFHEYHGR